MGSREPIERDDLMRELRELLGSPIREETQLDGIIVIVGGDPGEVVVRVSGNKVSVALFRVVWDRPYSPVIRPIPFATMNWRRVPESTLLSTLRRIIVSAREIRTSTYRRCEQCGENKPPEWMHDEKTCQSCAERYFGVVH
jgi:hypothetical protein